MLSDLMKGLAGLTSATNVIQSVAAELNMHLKKSPSDVANFSALWLKALEGHKNKIAMLYLANEMLQTNRCAELAMNFESVLPDAFRLTTGNRMIHAEKRRLLIVWRSRQVFRDEFIDLLSKTCDGMEMAAKAEAGNMKTIAKIADLVGQLEGFAAAKATGLAGEELIAALEKEQTARREFILEVAKTLKHLNVELTNHCVHLRLLNEKCDSLAM